MPSISAIIYFKYTQIIFKNEIYTNRNVLYQQQYLQKLHFNDQNCILAFNWPVSTSFARFRSKGCVTFSQVGTQYSITIIVSMN